MTLRIIGGEFRGRVLHAARGTLIRPLRAPVREALFNVLGQAVDDQVVWDLFAGSGATGIEALSRGARHVTFVEKSNQALAVLRGNLDALGPAVRGRAKVCKRDAWQPELNELDSEPPGIVFFDPPYRAVAEDPVYAAWCAGALAARLAPGGCLCFHFEEGLLDEDDFDDDLDVDLRQWGRTAMAILRRAADRHAASPCAGDERGYGAGPG